MRIAILGGGVGAMTAAYWLTNPAPDGTTPDHDITVYQLGWRLGGKGASGRNAAAGQRIEEHGLHIWMGFYANAFRMMRAVYGELNRPEGAPLATWKDAFKPQSVYTMAEKDASGQWMRNEWVVTTPIMPGEPGDQTGFPTPCGYVPSLLHHTHKHIQSLIDGQHHHSCPPHETIVHVEHLKLLHAALDEALGHAGPPHEPGTRPEPRPRTHHPILILALEAVQKLLGVCLELSGKCVGIHRGLQYADLAIATAIGVLRDLCASEDWTIIDDQEWRAWMLKHGLHQETAWCSAVRAMYDIVFAYRGGEASEENADLAAGTTTCVLARIMFDYYAGVFMKMQAGMGDTIFAPIYEALKKRGVKFKYCHRLREVVPSADGKTIDELHIGVQATVRGGGEYQPLVDVKDLPCWPSLPLYEQLVQGEELREKNIDLESYSAGWPDVEELTLRRGADFDHVVFGLSLGAVPIVCRKLLEQKQTWRDMIEHVKVVRTQAFQFWLSRNIADLGWQPALDGRNFGERAVFGTFVEPLDTWADMSQLIPREDWVVPVNNVAYFCGVMSDRDAPVTDTVVKGARGYLENDIASLWTTSVRNGRFRYEWLAVNDASREFSDDERFDAQFFRVNVEPTETYVLSVSGSTKYRLDPGDCGYENLSLAGDWVRNGFAIGCVESGVLGAMKGVRRLCPGMVIVE
jgi:uncharacterized protein with NAD-binding domain and iron-sulfur cluster